MPDAAYVDAWLVFARCDAQGDIGLFRVDAKAAGATVTISAGLTAGDAEGAERPRLS